MEAQLLISPSLLQKHKIELFTYMKNDTPYDIIRSILHIYDNDPDRKSYFLNYEFQKVDEEIIKIKNKYSFSTGVFDRDLMHYMYMRAENNQWYAEVKFKKGNDELFNMFGEIENHFRNIKKDIFGDDCDNYDHDNHAQENRNYYFKIIDESDKDNKQKVLLTKNGESIDYGKVFSFRDNHIYTSKKLEFFFNVDQIKIAKEQDKKPSYYVEYVITQINIIE